MRRLALPCAVTAALAALATQTARADRAIDAAVLTPPVDGYGLTVIDRARTPQRFEFGLLAQASYLHTPLKLTLNDPRMGLTEQPYRLIEQQVTLDVGFYLGLADFLSISAAVPLAVNVYDENALGQPVIPGPPGSVPTAMTPTQATGINANQQRQNVGPSHVGARDPRFALKLRFYGGRFFEIGSVLEATVPLGDSASFLGDKNATFRPRLLLGLLLKRVHVLGSFGAIVRETATFYEPNPTMAQLMAQNATPPVPLPARLQVAHELTWAGAVTVQPHRVLGLGVEAAGTIPVAGEFTQPTAAVLGAVYLAPIERIKLTLSGGAGVLSSSARNAEGRALLGLSYSLSPRAGGLL